MSSYLDAAKDAGYRGDEAEAYARYLEEEEYRRLYDEQAYRHAFNAAMCHTEGHPVSPTGIGGRIDFICECGREKERSTFITSSIFD